MDDQKVFSWDDEVENESSFLILEPGIYRFKVSGFERSRYEGGDKIPACPCADVELTVYDEFGRSTTIRERFFLVERMEWKISQFFIGVGLKKHGEKVPLSAFNKIIGREGMCKVIVDTYKSKKDGKEYENNKIDAYLDPEKNPVPSTAPGQAAWQSGKW